MEMIITMALFTLMLSLSLQILVDSTSQTGIGNVYQDLGDETRIDMEYMTRELYTSSPNHVSVADLIAGSNPPSYKTIYFQVPVDTDTTGNIVYGEGDKFHANDYITYFVTGNNLYRGARTDTTGAPSSTVLGTTDKKLSGDVQSLSFTLGNSNVSVDIALTLSKTLSGIPDLKALLQQ